ncbi:hypothetical protein CJ030_MR1G014138 [Morella rubra]|uniref:Uncharacterized protein n=1 Tax=Morella rubra TaxID=262757 RepID=A0A6A1WMH1_9ROSI|nr:hypothetical protein CJ030_MR1G014138 [Morella rubra]
MVHYVAKGHHFMTNRQGLGDANRVPLSLPSGLITRLKAKRLSIERSMEPRLALSLVIGPLGSDKGPRFASLDMYERVCWAVQIERICWVVQNKDSNRGLNRRLTGEDSRATLKCSGSEHSNRGEGDEKIQSAVGLSIAGQPQTGWENLKTGFSILIDVFICGPSGLQL